MMNKTDLIPALKGANSLSGGDRNTHLQTHTHAIKIMLSAVKERNRCDCRE